MGWSEDPGGIDSVLSDSLLLTAGLGFNRVDVSSSPMVNDLDTPPEYDVDMDLWFSNPGFVEFGEHNRDHHHAKLSFLAADALGSHQLDAGVEYQKLGENTIAFTPGGYGIGYFNNDSWGGSLPDGDGDGLVDYLLLRGAPPETARDPLLGTADGWSVFLQDQWQPAPQLTIRLGLRYDAMEHTNTVGETVADFDKVLPRLGVAWDVGGRSRHVLRAGWSRYMHPGVTNMVMFAPGVDRGSHEYYGLDILCAWYGICDRNTAAAIVGPEFVHVDDDGDEHPFYLFRYIPAIASETVDTLGVARLRVPYRDELILAYATRLANETSLELSYVKKDYHDQAEDTCNNNTWAWGDGEPPSLDDPSSWTDESTCTGWVRANIDGNLEDDFRHHVKLNGYLLFPLDFTLGVGAVFTSAEALSVYTNCSKVLFPSGSGLAELQRLGIDYLEMRKYCQSPSTLTLFLEPRASRRGSDYWRVDLQLSKAFHIGNVRLMGIVSVWNVVSEEAAVGRVQDPFDWRGWGTPTYWQQPRRWELGLRLEF